MHFLKITTTDNTLEYLALDKILSIQPQTHRIKILMGAGLYWFALPESLEIVNIMEVVTNEQL